MPFAGRVTASLQAGWRLFTGDTRLEDEPPDNQENMTTVPVAAVEIRNSSAAHDELKEKKRRLRRDIEDAAAQIDLMIAVHDTLQAQVNSTAVTTLRTARAAAAADDSKHKKHDQQHTGSPTDDQQQNITVHQQQDLQYKTSNKHSTLARLQTTNSNTRDTSPKQGITTSQNRGQLVISVTFQNFTAQGAAAGTTGPAAA